MRLKLDETLTTRLETKALCEQFGAYAVACLSGIAQPVRLVTKRHKLRGRSASGF